MRVFALSDPHLALTTPNKAMDRFGPGWVDHPTTMAAAWDATVLDDDVVLVPGDISWARNLDGAAADLAWLAARPGRKILCKGNHEYWWTSRNKVRAALPDGMYALEGDAVRIGDLTVGGTRLWDVPGVSYHDLIVWQGTPISAELSEADVAAALKVYERELGRLDRALDALDPGASLRIAITHYPPVGPGLTSNEVTDRFERARVAHVVFGHLHALDPARADEVGGELRGVHYHLTSCDWIEFAPVLICEV
jgi:predicted phosphohydrolase